MSTTIQVQRICQHCGVEFTAKTTVTKYCGDRCGKQAYKARGRSLKVEASNNEISAIRMKPVLNLKAKEFLSISETCLLMGISRRTVYRMIERGELATGKAGSRTILRRSDLDMLFTKREVSLTAAKSPITVVSKVAQPVRYQIADCYNIKEVVKKYGIADKTLYSLIKRNNVPKLKEGWYTYVPKVIIDKLLKIK